MESLCEAPHHKTENQLTALAPSEWNLKPAKQESPDRR